MTLMNRSRRKKERERDRFVADLSRDETSFAWPRPARAWNYGRGSRRIIRRALLIYAVLALIFVMGAMVDHFWFD
jgi:hypothetical protein